MKKKLTLVLLVLHIVVHAQNPLAYEVVINEIMADPTPATGLPPSEYIELRNVSTRSFNLSGWQIGDAGTTATIGSGFLLQPGSYVIVCANSAAPALAVFGAVVGVSNFPSLDNEGDQLFLRSKEGKTIHAVQYNIAWYENAVKSQGGWSLEMIDAANACGASNWLASTDPNGGTPGKINSIAGINKDAQPPVLLNAFASDNQHIVLRFDEPLDSAQAAVAANYTVSDNIGKPLSAETVPPFFNRVALVTSLPLAVNKIYTVTASGIGDCAGNAIGAYHTVKLGLAVTADTGAVVINELLFNPNPGGSDYAELYNRSNTIVNLKDCYTASRLANGTIAGARQISAESRLLFPGEYVVLTEDVIAFQHQYLVSDPSALMAVVALPSLPDDKGNLVILNTQGTILDELSYDADWHFKLIENDAGVSLERIDYNQPAQNKNNWHSAATSAGYGTPGYQNSQFKTDQLLPGSISLSPSVFSPDNDGTDDFLTISYQFPEQGYVCNITAFDAAGHIVRYITHNALCGVKGYFRWDGLNEKNTALPIGVYVIYAEVFNLKGSTKHFKEAVTLARHLQ